MTTTTRERSIVLRPDEVRSILDGTLVEIRRAIKPQPDPYYPPFYSLKATHGQGLFASEGPHKGVGFGQTNVVPVFKFCPGWAWLKLYGASNLRDNGGRAWQYGDQHERWDCPFGEPGTVLVGKEGAYIAPPNFCDPNDANAHDNKGRPRVIGYAASMDGEAVRCANDYGVAMTTASRMPRWACRLWLEVTVVRVERDAAGVWEWVVSIKRIEGKP